MYIYIMQLHFGVINLIIYLQIPCNDFVGGHFKQNWHNSQQCEDLIHYLSFIRIIHTKVLKGITCKNKMPITFEHECHVLLIDNVECSSG